MRYFKYKNENKNFNNALKEYYLSLTKDEKRTVRKEKVWSTISLIVSFIIFFSCITVGIYSLTLIPKPSAVGWQFLFYIGMALLGIVLLVISFLLTYAVTFSLRKQVRKFNLPVMKQEILSKACAHLREYYQMQEPYLLTKCYYSNDEMFSNHDVCIFVVGKELRITADIINGFLHGNRDLGCYAFVKEEICLSKKRQDNLLIAELTTKDSTFLLGYRAKSFIEKYLTDSVK